MSDVIPQDVVSWISHEKESKSYSKEIRQIKQIFGDSFSMTSVLIFFLITITVFHREFCICGSLKSVFIFSGPYCGYVYCPLTDYNSANKYEPHSGKTVLNAKE